ncbi:MAG: amidohydrolase, partial [Saprospiraceae bacterium]|nr:amidohydrolase [Saprospiraceae bacterium]
MTLRISSLLFCLIFSATAFSQKKDNKWDVNNPEGDWNWKDVSFTVDEGTWMNLDVSPDGKTIAFDMLGDIYTMPADGGKATPLRTGVAWEVQPRFNPSGDKLLFTSDAGGGDNIWVMNTNGSDAKQITKESFRLLNNGAWTPDGEYIIARKHFTSGRSLGAGELWMYHITGGSGIQLTKKRNDQQDVNEPVVSPDGRYVYYCEDMYPGGFFQYNKDPNSQIYAIKRYDREEGKIETVISGPGGAVRPQLSNDGSKLAFIRRVRTKTVLFIHDLETGQNFHIFDNLSKDQQEAWAIFGLYPGFDWTPDDKHIVIYGLGKLWKVDSASGEASEIPFTVDVKTKVGETVKFKNDAFNDDMEVKVLRNAVTSPDGSQLVFNALGHLWRTDLPDGIPERLTESDAFEFEPSYSSDGKSLVYVTWDDEEMGAVHVMNLATGTSQQLTTDKGIYRTPSMSPDGTKIVYRKDGGNGHQGFAFCKEPGIYMMDADGSNNTLVTPRGEYPQFTPDGTRITYQTGGYLFGSLTKSVESVNLNGKDKKEHFDGKYAQKYSISPDHKWVAWSELYKVYVAPFPKTGKKVGLTSKTKAVPVAQVGRDAGINIHWSPDSKKLHWTLANEYFSDELTERFKFLEGSLDSLPPMGSLGLKIKLDVPMDKPEGVIALKDG